MKKYLLVLNIFILFSLQLSSQWLQNFNGPYNKDDAGSCVAIDNQNNVIVGGYCNTNNGDADMAVVKYSSGGSLLWSYIYSGSGNTEDKTYGIVVDQNNNIFITGFTDNDYCTIKLSPQGNEVWVKKYNDPFSGEDKGYGIVVDNMNNIIITGWSYGGPLNDFDIYTIKYDQDGIPLWNFRYNGSGSGEDKPYGIVVDQNNNIIITGTTYSSSSSSLDYLTMKLSSNGSPVWTSIYNGTGGGEDRSYGIVTDQNGGDPLSDKIFITGASMGTGSGFDFTTIGYNSDGSVIFVDRYNGTGNNEDIARSIGYSNQNEIIITGSSRSGTSVGTEDIVTIRYEEDGDRRWVKTYNGSGNNTDMPYKVVPPENSNNIITVVGYTTIAGKKDILLLSYSSSGNFNRDIIINGTGNKDDIAFDGISISNDIVITGFTSSSNNTDFVTSRITNSQLTEVIRDPLVIPSSYNLYQNYPNPFNPETRIKFDIPEESDVNLTIYNSTGQKVESLINRTMKAGSYEIVFHSDKLTSGVYFCTLRSGGFVKTNKLILVK